MGLMNEMDPIALQLMDEDIHPLSGFQMNDQARGDSISEQQQQQGEEEEEGKTRGNSKRE